MKKSYNMIKAQELRVIETATDLGKWCNNAKHHLDMQRIAQITRRTLTQHGFPIFGEYDHNEQRPVLETE